MASSYDLAVIGGGPGGYVSAIRAAQLGARVVVVEKDSLGGTCLNVGCIPTKSLLTSAELYALAGRGSEFGVEAKELRFNFAAAQERKAKVVATLVNGVGSLFKAAGVESRKGTATLKGKGRIAIGKEEINAKDILVATGSVPARIPIKGVEHTLDSTAILELTRVPERLAVIGGGVVGMEFASLYAELGSQVTVLEMLPRILPMVEADISNLYRRHLEKLGGKIHTEAKVEGVVKDGRGFKVRFGIGGEGAETGAEVVLLAAGRTPYTDGLGLDAAGVELDGRRVKVDDHLRTSAAGVWACGDVIGGIMLAHVASYEGICAVENIAGGGDRVPDYHAAPNCIYTDPEIANVGLGETEARERGIQVKVGRFPLQASARALTLGQAEGMVKVIAEAGSERLLGVQMIGPRVTDLVAEATLAIQRNLTIHDLELTMHAHPTMAESLLQAALAADGRAIEIPNRKPRAEAAPAAAARSAEPKEESSVARSVEERESTPAGNGRPAKPPPVQTDPSLKLERKNRDELMRLYRQMYFIRRFEERCQEMYTRAKIGGYCHLNIGEEATVVGGIAALKGGDYIYTSYREHGHAIARGVDPKAVMAELFGRETGTSHGRGGSMHIYDAEYRFMGGYGIVGGHLPLAVGAGFAIKYEKAKDVVFCMFGDGATNIGAFHESLNFAAVFKLPVVWFCINNKYGMGTSVERASAVPDMYRKACAYDMEAIQVDGMNVLDVLHQTGEIVEKTRKDSKPRFIEAVTYRFKGHSVVDPDKYRDEKEKEEHRKSDPVSFFETELGGAKIATPDDFRKLKAEVEKEVEAVIEYADQSPNPDLKELHKYVYAGEWEARG
ncbi:MAG: dihydrolipoyl dehydrogenase [Chloroflexi bacterium]|nr:MAG: dihydrolipoyl dehydrogenase [Chloroflexota bacterium]